PRGLERVLHVRAVDVLIPREAWKIGRLELGRVRREPDDVEVVLRERRANERVQRERDLLRREETTPEEHRTAHVDEDRRRRLRDELRAVDVEVVRGELHRDFRALADHGVPHRARKVEQEGIAELVGLELVGWIASAAARFGAVSTKGVFLQRREDLLERPLADLADPPRRELVALAVLADEACLFEELGHATELVERLPGR